MMDYQTKLIVTSKFVSKLKKGENSFYFKMFKLQPCTSVLVIVRNKLFTHEVQYAKINPNGIHNNVNKCLQLMELFYLIVHRAC